LYESHAAFAESVICGYNPDSLEANMESSHGEEGKEGEEGEEEDKVEKVDLTGYAAQRPWRMPGPLH
jgi:hypothetical protein